MDFNKIAERIVGDSLNPYRVDIVAKILENIWNHGYEKAIYDDMKHKVDKARDQLAELE